jgi:hypothetical protein
LLQDDIAKFVSDPTPPPRLVDIPEEGKGKVKELHEVGEVDDTITIEDTTDEEDGETLQERFQRFLLVSVGTTFRTDSWRAR